VAVPRIKTLLGVLGSFRDWSGQSLGIYRLSAFLWWFYWTLISAFRGRW